MSSSRADLAGVQVVVTRPRAQADGFRRLLETRGAEVIVLPMIDVEVPEDWTSFDQAMNQVHTYDAVLIGSINAVRSVRARGHTLSVPVVAVGKKTAAALAGLAEDVRIPRQANAEGMVQLIEESMKPVAGRRFLFLRAPTGREWALDALISLGAVVHPVEAYRVVPRIPGGDELQDIEPGAVYTFLSGATLSAFLAQVPEARARLARGRVAVIGPIAYDHAKELGIRVDIVPSDTSQEAMVDALVARLGVPLGHSGSRS